MGCLKLEYEPCVFSSFTVWKNKEKLETSEKSSKELQGQYAEKDEETGWNAFELRMYDPLIGRWLSVDPAGQFASPYNGMGNNPINGVDPDGAWLFGLFGSTSEQRQRARSLRDTYDGDIQNFFSKDISVKYVTEGFFGSEDGILDASNNYGWGPVVTVQGIREDGNLDLGANLNAFNDNLAAMSSGPASGAVSSIFNDLPAAIVTATVPVSRIFMTLRFRIALSSGGSGVASSSALSSTVNLYSRGSVLRAPANGIIAGRKFYKGGQFYPGPRLYFGRQAYSPTFAPLSTGSTAAPWANSLMNAPAWIRYGTAAGLGGAAIYRNYRMHVDR